MAAQKAGRSAVPLRLALLCLAFSGGSAWAAPAGGGASATASGKKDRPARFVMGVKFGGGGTLSTTPDETELGRADDGEIIDLPFFDATRGGYTTTAGLFVEGIFFENLGIEVGGYFVKHSLLEEVDWSYTITRTPANGPPTTVVYNAKSDQQLSWTAFHLPILIKAVIPSGNTRLSLGVGPEFTFTQWSEASFKVSESSRQDGQACPECMDADGNPILVGPRSAFKGLLSQNKNSVYLTMVFGIEIQAGDFLIPIDLHWSYNFSQGKRYADRGYVNDGTLIPGDEIETLTLFTRDNMYGGLRVGLAYQF